MGHRFLEPKGIRSMIGAEEEEFAEVAPGIVVGSCDDAALLRSERLELVTVNVDGCCQSYDISPTTRMDAC